MHRLGETDLPGWMPVNILNYLQHTMCGVPIRELARQQDCHASTILRQVRRIENRRDDPLVDGGLLRLGQSLDNGLPLTPSEAELEASAIRVLRRLWGRGGGVWGGGG
ncbi:MAG: hypothetical protein AB3N23_05920 [Paracoccaceae bacterium]